MHNKTEKTTQVFLGLLCFLVNCSSVEAASPKRNVREGNLRYKQGDYAASRERYLDALKRDPESDIVNFNLGTALYKEKDYEKSIDHLQKALLSDDDDLKESAHYNLGNALYQSGMAHVDDDINLAISSLENSLNQFKGALSANEEDKDAKHNYDYVQKELLRLKELQKQQQQDQQKSDKSKEQRQDQQSKGEQQEQKEGQQQQQQKEKNENGQEQSEQGEQSQEKQGKSERGHGQEGEKDYNEHQEPGAQAQDAQELTEKEAQMLLEGYQQTEAPQGLFKVYPKNHDTAPVYKDW